MSKRLVVGEKSLLEESGIWKREADSLLKESRLIDTLSLYGTVRLTGSYRLDLMMSGDIDIKVVNPKANKRSALAILRRLIDGSFFNGYVFYDWTTRHRPEDFPRGFYIGLKRNFTPFNGRKWKIDIWFLRKDDARELSLMKWVEQRLTLKRKLSILKFKRLREAGRFEVSGTETYQAVLKRKITSSRQFFRFANTASASF